MMDPIPAIAYYVRTYRIVYPKINNKTKLIPVLMEWEEVEGK